MRPRERAAGVWKSSLALALGLTLGACSNDADRKRATERGADAAPDATPDAGAPRGLPFEYARADQGDPVSSAELTAATERWLALLEATRYFAAVSERVHGWPESDPEGRFWYASWWDGVVIRKEGGEVTFDHVETGSDNNGGRMAPLLEGACWAFSTWGGSGTERLVRKMARAYTSWILAMERTADEVERPLLTRAAYPPSTDAEEEGRRYRIDYSKNHPGLDNPATEYVHLPDNPTWGELWVKNKRSKDDIGRMVRSIAHLEQCRDLFENGDTRADLDDLRGRYAAWARRVEDDGWRIATWNKARELWLPPDDLARFVTALDTECDATLLTRLLGRGDPGDIDCGTGINGLEEVFVAANHQEAGLFNSYHQAAILLALTTGHPDVAEAHLPALGERITTTLDRLDAGDPPNFFSAEGLAELMIDAANVGLPLTSREVRWLHERIDESLAFHGRPEASAMFRLFDPATPDGQYGFDPFGPGIEFRSIGALLGTCFSRWRNPATRPVLDCDLVRDRAPPLPSGP